MPRNGRGGRRSGTPGKAYAQRSDLNTQPRAQPVRTTSADTYGDATRQQAAQQAVPLPQQPPPPAPGQLGFTEPTRRPSEPITAGLPMGPGPGPEALGMESSVLDELRAVYAAYPSEELRAAIEDEEARS